jgi:hypothetical protein
VLWYGIEPQRIGVKIWMEDNDALVYRVQVTNVSLQRISGLITMSFWEELDESLPALLELGSKSA